MTPAIALISAVGVVLAALLALIGVLNKTAADKAAARAKSDAEAAALRLDGLNRLVDQLQEQVDRAEARGERLETKVDSLEERRREDAKRIQALEAERSQSDQHIMTLEDHINRQLPPPPPPRPGR